MQAYSDPTRARGRGREMNQQRWAERAPARDRFIAATKEQAMERMRIQSDACLEQIATVNSFPYIFTNAGVLAEACAHWAFIAHPELRAEDDTFWSQK